MFPGRLTFATVAKGSGSPWSIPSLLLGGTYAGLLRSLRRASGVKDHSGCLALNVLALNPNVMPLMLTSPLNS